METFFTDLAAIFASPYIAVIFVAALAFDFVNGFHDSANSIATVVSTRVMSPFYAVVWAAMWNFVAAWVIGFHVANTVGKWVDFRFVTPDVIFAGLLGAIVWDLLTWWWGLPTSSSHALLGGFGGAAIAFAGTWTNVLVPGALWITLAFIVVAPMIGLALGWGFMVLVMWMFRRMVPVRVDRTFRVVQLFTSAAYSLGHGANDAQKTMGIIGALLYASLWKNQQAAFEAGKVTFPFWIAFVCFLAMGAGTMCGGWRIIKTMGMKITKLHPHGGACSSLAAAISLFTASGMGVPVSTTHTITGAIIGVGSVQRLSAVRWGVAQRVVWAWILTIPASGIVGALCYYIIKAIPH